MSSETDGFEIQRPGSEELDIVIQLFLYNNPNKFKCSPQLESLIGQSIATRTNILAGIWEYIKINRLQDQENREYINCDSALKDLFGTEKLQINHILGKIKAHISFPDPIEITHRIRLGEIKNNEQVYDIKVEFDYPFSIEILPFFSKHVSAAEEKSQMTGQNQNNSQKPPEHAFLQLEQRLKRMEKKQIDLIEKLKRHSYKRDNYLAYSENPLSYIDSLIIQQNSLLKMISTENIFDNVENPDNPQFLLACEDFVEDEIKKYIKNESK